MKLFFIHKINRTQIEVKFLKGEDKIADISTKALEPRPFDHFKKLTVWPRQESCNMVKTGPILLLPLLICAPNAKGSWFNSRTIVTPMHETVAHGTVCCLIEPKLSAHLTHGNNQCHVKLPACLTELWYDHARCVDKFKHLANLLSKHLTKCMPHRSERATPASR